MEWISVKDALPETGAPVLACMRVENGEFDSGWWFGCCVYREFGFPWVRFDNPEPVDYWMPLPDPPTK